MFLLSMSYNNHSFNFDSGSKCWTTREKMSMICQNDHMKDLGYILTRYSVNHNQFVRSPKVYDFQYELVNYKPHVYALQSVRTGKRLELQLEEDGHHFYVEEDVLMDLSCGKMHSYCPLHTKYKIMNHCTSAGITYIFYVFRSAEVNQFDFRKTKKETDIHKKLISLQKQIIALSTMLYSSIRNTDFRMKKAIEFHNRYIKPVTEPGIDETSFMHVHRTKLKAFYQHRERRVRSEQEDVITNPVKKIRLDI